MYRFIFKRFFVLSFVLVAAMSHVVGTPLQTDPFHNPKKWSAHIAQEVNKYFSKEYADDGPVFGFTRKNSPNIIRKKIKGRDYVVYRKGHGLNHGMRQAFLAVDMAEALYAVSKRDPNAFSSIESRDMLDWVKRKYEQDPYFLAKLELTNAFQRSGRQSEENGKQHPDLYRKYVLADMNNFERFARKYVGPNSLFKTMHEFKVYKESLSVWIDYQGDIDKTNEDLYFLKKIVKASHMFDLRRLPGVPMDDIKEETFKGLFRASMSDAGLDAEKEFFSKIWQRTGNYLYGTGDRDAVQKRKRFSDIWFIYATTPNKLTWALHNARQKSKVVF